MYRSGNPTRNEAVYAPAERWAAGAFDSSDDAGGGVAARPTVMTLQGTINKMSLLLGICVIAAIAGWNLTLPEGLGGKGLFGVFLSPMLVTFGGIIVAFVIAMVTLRKPQAARVTAPMYAMFEGLGLGGISAIAAGYIPVAAEGGGFMPNTNIVMQAMLMTFGTFGAMLVAYTTRIIKPTERFKAVMSAAIGGIFLVYMISFGMSMFGLNMPYLHDASPMGVGISIFVLIVAALSLVLDFELVETGIKNGAPLWAEWYAGFSLLVTLAWLYIEFLRLLMKLRGMADR